MRCWLQVYLNQTDFDNQDGAVEFVTLRVAGVEACPVRELCHGHCRSWRRRSLGRIPVEAPMMVEL